MKEQDYNCGNQQQVQKRLLCYLTEGLNVDGNPLHSFSKYSMVWCESDKAKASCQTIKNHCFTGMVSLLMSLLTDKISKQVAVQNTGLVMQ